MVNSFFFFFYLWLCWVLVSVWGLSLVVASGGHSSSRCAGLFTIVASLVAEHRLQTRRLSSCGSRAQLLRGMWDPPRPGLEPVSPASAGRLSTTAPPGKPWSILYYRRFETCIILLLRKNNIMNSFVFILLLQKLSVSCCFWFICPPSLSFLFLSFFFFLLEVFLKQIPDIISFHCKYFSAYH